MKEDPDMAYEFEIKELTAQPTATIKKSVELSKLGETFGELLPEVFQYVTQKGGPAGAPFGRYHVIDETWAEIEAGLPVAEPVEPSGRIEPSELPGGKAVVTWHVGPYEDLHLAHRAAEQWIADNGLQSSGPAWEVYVTDPGEEPDPTKWRTEVVYPVQ